MIQTNCNGVLTFISKPLTIPFSDLFTVSVGCVAKSKREALTNSENLVTFVSSKSHEGVYVTYDVENTEWIRKPNGQTFNLFVLCKTRAEKPFFATHEFYPCDGAVMGLTPTEKAKNCFKGRAEALEFLNSQPWDELGFKSPDGRYQFSQRALSNVWLVEQ